MTRYKFFVLAGSAILVVVIAGCATKLNSVQAGYSKIGANLTNAKKDATYNLQNANSKRLSSCQADGNGNVYFPIQSPEDEMFNYSYLYLTDGKDVIKFKNDQWKFLNPVWDKAVSIYKPIIQASNEASKAEAEFAQKSKSLDESLAWLDSSKVYDEDCRLPESVIKKGKIANIAGNLATAIALGNLIFPGSWLESWAAEWITNKATNNLVNNITKPIQNAGGEIAENLVIGKEKSELAQCQQVVAYIQQCEQEIPEMEQRSLALKADMETLIASAEPEIERLKQTTVTIDERTGFGASVPKDTRLVASSRPSETRSRPVNTVADKEKKLTEDVELLLQVQGAELSSK